MGMSYIIPPQLLKNITSLSSKAKGQQIGLYHFPLTAPFDPILPGHPRILEGRLFERMYPESSILFFHLYKDPENTIMVIKGASHINEVLEHAIEQEKAIYEYYWTDPPPRTRRQIQLSENMTENNAQRIDAYMIAKEALNHTYKMESPNGPTVFDIANTYHCTHCDSHDKRATMRILFQCPDCQELSLLAV